jgi:peptidoglycan/LPS O-acetylase OafA/YrhL
MLSPAIEENRPLPRRSLPCLLLASGIGVFLWKVAKRAGYMYSMRMFAFLFLGAAVILLFTLLAQNLQKHNFGRGIYRILWFCGSISLEIYLVFDRVRELLEFVPGIKGLPSYGMDLLAAVLTIPLAWLLRRLCTAIANGLTAIGKFGESRRCACKK